MATTPEGALPAIVAAIPSALLVEDVERRVVVANVALCQMLRLPVAPETLVGEPTRPLNRRFAHLAREPARALDSMDRAIAGARPARLPAVELVDGGTIQLDYAPATGHGGSALHIWQYRDVTDELALESAARASEAHLRAIIDHAPVGVFEADRSGGCLAVNRRWEELTGMSAEQAVGTGWFAAVHPDDREIVLDPERVAAHGGATHDLRIVRPDGEVRWVLVNAVALRDRSGEVSSYVGMVVDITRRRRAEDALRASEARSAAMIATALDGIVAMDHSGRVLEFNAAAEAIFGHRRADVLGRSAIDLLLPEDVREATHEGLRAYLETGVARVIGRRIEATCLRADGEPFPAELAFTDIPEADPPMLTAFVRDISDRRRFQAELARARDQALEASRLKSEFLAVMSHEIRTPMYGVTGAVDLLRESALEPGQRELVEILDESSRSLMALIDEILDFSKIEAGRVELHLAALDPAAIVEAATELFSAEARRKGVSLLAIVAPDVPAAVVGDAGRLRQIVANLVGNAVKFTDEGEVVVRLRAGDRPGRLCLAVSDSAGGIPESVRETLFEPFTQGDPSSRRAHGGTGLGLAICERLARLMGGGIAVDSRPGDGTTMTVTIAAEPVAGAPAGWEPPAGLRGRRAGVAMGSRRLADAMREALAAIGLDVPGSVEPEGVDVWVAEVGAAPGPPAGATMAVLCGERRSVVPIPVRRARLAEIVEAALARPGRAPDAPNGRSPAEEPAPLEAARVLVVDDNEVNRTLATLQLTRLGVAAQAVGSGEEAIEAVRAERYDAVLMDLRMPDMDGLEATRRIRALRDGTRARVPIIAMTADVQPHERDLCLGAGMDDHLAKPLALEDVQRMLAAWLSPTRGDPAALVPAAAAGELGGSARRLDALAADVGSVEPVAGLIELWLRELPDRGAELRRAVKAEDWPAVREVAHVLKSTGGLLGGSSAAPAAGLEAAARDGDADGVVERLAALLSALEDDAATLARWLERTLT